MVLTNEEIKELRRQLSEQIRSMPEEQRSAAQTQIDSMSPEALEAMLNQQKVQSGKTIFRMLVAGEVDSVKVGENPDAIAVLDINPISRGHAIIIPKTAISDKNKIPKGVYGLAEELSKKVIEHLGAKSTRAEASEQFGEAVLHLIPIYDAELDLNSKRSKASPDELVAVKRSLEVIKIDKPKPRLIVKRKPKKVPVLKLNRRIP